MEQFRAVKTEKEKQPLTPRSWPGAWSGPQILLLNVNDFVKNQHQIRPLCDHGGTRQKHSHLETIAEHRQSIHIGHVRKYREAQLTSDCCFFSNDSVSSAALPRDMI